MNVTHTYKPDYIRMVKQGFILACIITMIAFVFTDKASAKEGTWWTKSTQVKYNSLVAIGMKGTHAKSLINYCKKVKESAMCVKIWASIFWNESSMFKSCYNNNCSGMKWWALKYKSIDAGIKDWVSRWDKYWYKQKSMHSFYSNKPWVLPATRYCLSEYQPNGKKLDYCPNGYKNSNAIFSRLNWE